MTWVDHHRRDEALRIVIELADARRDGLLPWDEIPDAATVFGTTTDVLRALQMRWCTRLAGSIDTVLADQPMDLEQAVVHAWRYTAADLPGVRAILDANLEHPAIATARHKDHVLLATAAGRAGLEDAAAIRIGRAIEDRARGITVETSMRGAA
ncbi:MAG: hypothetical protein ABJA81_02250 [Nocardioidaceae bacterium]